MLKIAIKQMNACVADFSGNSKEIIESMHQATQHKADLLVFPELALIPYISLRQGDLLVLYI